MHKLALTLVLLSSSVFAASSLASDSLSDVLASDKRLDADVLRDARSRPDLILPLLNLAPGDRVADIWAGGGYYSELFSHLVGDSGEVLVVNNLAYQQFSEKRPAGVRDNRTNRTDTLPQCNYLHRSASRR